MAQLLPEQTELLLTLADARARTRPRSNFIASYVVSGPFIEHKGLGRFVDFEWGDLEELESQGLIRNTSIQPRTKVFDLTAAGIEEAESNPRLASGATFAVVMSLAERTIAKLLDDLHDDRSRLHSELTAARADIEMLKAQAQSTANALREVHRSRNRKLGALLLAGLAGLLGSCVEGAASAVADRVMSEHEQSSPDVNQTVINIGNVVVQFDPSLSAHLPFNLPAPGGQEHAPGSGQIQGSAQSDVTGLPERS